VSTIYLVRHGRTALNAEGRFRGRQDASLDDIGREEAAAVGDALASVGLAAVYTSPLARARETADAIAHRGGLQVKVIPALIDLDCGRWQGLTPAEAQARDPHEYEVFRTEPLAAAAPEGESVSALKRRVLRGVEQIATRHRTDPIAAVTHDVPLRIVLAGAKQTARRFWGVDIVTGTMLVLTIGSDGEWLIDNGAGRP
jgi:broad specificity phosphatase PhoE